MMMASSQQQQCWDIIFASCTSPTWKILHSWHWIYTLSVVCKTFSQTLSPLRTAIVQRMCDFDGEKGMIWKKKAMEIFTLTDRDLRSIKFSILHATRRREVHLMLRGSVLTVALAKHGGSFEGINDAMCARAARLDALRTKRNDKKRKAVESRREIVDATLIAEGIPLCGFLYESVLAGKETMDIEEFRFRTHVHSKCNEEYEDVIGELHEDMGYFFPGIHAEARSTMRRRLAARGVRFDTAP